MSKKHKKDHGDPASQVEDDEDKMDEDSEEFHDIFGVTEKDKTDG